MGNNRQEKYILQIVKDIHDRSKQLLNQYNKIKDQPYSSEHKHLLKQMEDFIKQ